MYGPRKFLVVKKPKALSLTSFNITNIKLFFINIDDVHKGVGIVLPDVFWTTDETGRMSVNSPKTNVVASKICR